MSDIVNALSELNTGLEEITNEAQAVVEQLVEKVDTLQNIKDQLEEAHSEVVDFLQTASQIEEAVTQLDDLMSEASDEGVS